MTKQHINIGDSVNDKRGDPLRTAFGKVNDNFTELYALTGGASAALTELAQDYAAPLFTHADNVGISFSYNDTANKLIATVANQLPAQANNSGKYLTTNGATLSWATVAGGGSSVTTSATAPTNPIPGDLWYDTVSGRTYVYYDSSWVDSSPVDGVGIQTDLGDWAFKNNSLYSLSGGYIDNSDTTHGSTAGLTIPTNGNTAPLVLINTYGNVTLVSGASPGALKTWSLGTEGKLTLPAGTTYEYLSAPLTGHGDGLARLDFTLVTDGVVAQWAAASASPAGSGYNIGDTFTFDAEFLGIPGASVTIEVLTIGVGGGVENLAFTQPPLYPADIYRDSPINLQVGPESNRWTFGATGNLTLPTGGIIKKSDGSTYSTDRIVNGAKTVSLGTDGTLSLPAGPTLLTNFNQIVSATINRTGASTDTQAIAAARDTWIGLELNFTDIRDQDEEIFASGTRPWVGLPSWEAYPLITSYAPLSPILPPASSIVPAAATATQAYLAYKELVSNIDIVSGNSAFSFENTGSLRVPGVITKDNSLILVSSGVSGVLPNGNSASVNPDGQYGRVFIRTDNGETLRTWTFDIDGDLIFPDGTTTTGKSITVPANEMFDFNLSQTFPPGATKISINTGGISTDRTSLYLTTSGNNTWTLNSSQKRIEFNDSSAFIKFGTATKDNTGASNDIELFSYGADNGAGAVYISAGSNPTTNRWKFDASGKLALPAGGDVIDSTSVSQLAKRVEGSWTVTAGTNTYSFEVPANGAYQLWVRGNVPNGIISYIATVHVTNANVPVIGSQRGYNYTDGGSPILLTSMPSQFVGTEGTITTASIAGTTNNRFDFGISNTSGSTQTIYYGWIKI